MKYLFALFIYRLVLLILLPIILIIFLIRSKNQPQYRHRLLERLGILPRTFTSDGIIVHAASVGEVIALKPFIEQLLITYPNETITVTTFTPTGSAQVKKLFGKRVQHCYLPFDSVFCSLLFLKKLKPKIIIFMETELWPNLIAQSKQAKIKLLLINGRLSSNSMRHYQKIAWLISPTIQHFDKILCQSEHNYANFIKLGADAEKCVTSGNLKYDLSVSTDLTAKQHELAQFVEGKRDIWIVASTHAGDETLALTAFKSITAQFPDLLLLLVPRHPERFDAVATLCQQADLNIARRSKHESVTQDKQVWLLDSLGELMAAYSLSTLVTMGGSFSAVGGHNPLEPALFKKPIIVGPNMSNFLEVQQQLSDAHGIIQLTNEQDIESALAHQVIALLQSTAQQNELGKNAFQVVQQNQGASAKSITEVQLLL